MLKINDAKSSHQKLIAQDNHEYYNPSITLTHLGDLFIA